MLDRNVFMQGIEKLITEYDSRGFVMTKARGAQWYEFMKELSNSDFNKKIDSCLKTCRRVPFMADVLDIKTEESSGATSSDYNFSWLGGKYNGTNLEV